MGLANSFAPRTQPIRQRESKGIGQISKQLALDNGDFPENFHFRLNLKTAPCQASTEKQMRRTTGWRSSQ